MLNLTRPVACGLATLHGLAHRIRPVPMDEIAREYMIPKPLLRRILRALAKAGLIQGRSDRGFSLSRPASSISVHEVIAAIQEPRPPRRECDMDYPSCAFRRVCPVATLCRDAHERLQEVFQSFTVADLAREPVPMP